MAGDDEPGRGGDERRLASDGEGALHGDEIAASLFTHVDEVAELPDGFGYRFANGDESLAEIVAFIAAERRHSPFLAFEIAFSPNDGPLWLRLRGASWVKAFIAETFSVRVGPGAGGGGAGA